MPRFAVVLALLLGGAQAFSPLPRAPAPPSFCRRSSEVETAEAEPAGEAPAPAAESVVTAVEAAAPKATGVSTGYGYMRTEKKAMITSLPDATTGSAIKQEWAEKAAAKADRISKLPGVETKSDLQTLATTLCPAVPYWDPLGLVDKTFWGEPSEATIGFLRQAEIKHGRVAMAGFVGFIVHAQGYKWGFDMTLDGRPWPSASSVPGLWDALPQASKWQIILFVGALEWYDEWHFSDDTDKVAKPKHYMRGGLPGKYPAFDKPLPWNLYDPFGFSKNRSEEDKAKGRLAEINNGRLAMIGLMGFLAEAKVPGSVPFLKGLIAPYDGDVMVPFSNDFSLFAKAAADAVASA